MKKPLSLVLLLIVSASTTFLAASCDRKEKVLDVQTRDGGIEVERDKKTGAVDIKVE